MFNNYCYQPRPLSAKAQDYRERNLKAQATIATNKKIKRDAYLAIPANAELIKQLEAVYNPAKGGFLTNMMDSFNEWGSLTEKQEAAVRNVMVKRAEQAVVRVAENAADAAVSNHVGTVGVRQCFELTMVKAFPYTSQFGEAFVQTLKDADGNVFVYFGQHLASLQIDGDGHAEAFVPQPGDTIALKATVKAHDQRDGVKQTIINRPKILQGESI